MSKFPELIYFWGEAGTGKTTAALSIAKENPTDTFFYIEADRRVGRIIYEHYGELPNVMVMPGFTHEEIVRSVDVITGILKAATDPLKLWVIIDTISKVYNDTQDSFSLKYHKIPIDQLRDKRALSPEKGATFDQLTGPEWQIIVRMLYNEIVYPLTHYYGNNSVLIAHQRPIQSTRGNIITKATVPTDYNSIFEAMGIIPNSHHALVPYVDTCLHFNNITEKFTIQTVKETGRKWLWQPTVFDNFWSDYIRLTSRINGTS